MNWDEVEVDYTRRVYPVLNDLVGGFDLSYWDKPVSEHNAKKGEFTLAWGMMAEVALHISQCWNEARHES